LPKIAKRICYQIFATEFNPGGTLLLRTLLYQELRWVIQTGYWPDFNLERVLKLYYYKKHVADFFILVKIGEDQRLHSPARCLNSGVPDL